MSPNSSAIRNDFGSCRRPTCRHCWPQRPSRSGVRDIHREEAYTLAIILSELIPHYSGIILATDVDQEALQFAQEGIYPPGRLRHLPPGHLEKYFLAAGENYQIKDKIKSQVRFKRHDLLRGPFGRGFDLILCRNVVIYFTEEAKDKIYRGFTQALNPGGILFTGATEQIFASRDLGLINLSPFFYQKN